MKLKNSRFPLTRLPKKIDLTLFLIQQELKSFKLFDSLDKLGMSDCPYQTNLDALVLDNVGLNDGKDETISMYMDIIGKRSRKLTDELESLTGQAIKVYVDLQIEKRRRLAEGQDQAN